jgi:hypothetical protein
MPGEGAGLWPAAVCKTAQRTGEAGSAHAT